MIKRRIATGLILSLLAGLWASMACAETEWKVMQTFALQSTPVDVAIALDGRTVFVLNDRGEVEIYTTAGQYRDKITVGTDIDGIKPTARDDFLLLINSKEKRLQVIALAYAQSVNTQGSPFKGPADAPVEIVVFSDFECSACAGFVSVLDQVRARHPDAMKVVFKHYPLQSHRFAQQAAAAAVAAGRQDAFWEFHDVLFHNFRQLNAAKIKEIAEFLGLDQQRLEKDMQAPATAATIRNDMSEAQRLGVRGTPTVFVNGRMLQPHTLEAIEAAVEKTLSEASNPASAAEPAAKPAQ